MKTLFFKKFQIFNFLLSIFLLPFLNLNIYGSIWPSNTVEISEDISSQIIDFPQLDPSTIIKAIQESDFKILDLLFNNTNIDLFQNIFNNGNVLHIATFYNNLKVVRYFLSDHFDDIYPLIDTKNQNGLTPLMLASNLGYNPIIAFLVSKGANIEEKDLTGKTAIHFASFAKQLLSIELLSYLGADINAVDNSNLRAVDYLRNNKDDKSVKVVELLGELNKENEKLNIAPPLYSFLPLENLVLEGGGAKGIAYIGALKELDSLNALRDLKRVAGTSAGAIIAAFIALGYDINEMQAILFETDFSQFLDYYISEEKIINFFENTSITTIFKDVIEDMYELFKNPITTIEKSLTYFKDIFDTDSLCAGEDFRKWIEKKIYEKTNIHYLTFKELRHLIEKDNSFKHLHIFTTKIQPALEIFRMSTEDKKFDDVIISDAVRASMSIPGVFAPHSLYIKNSENQRVKKEDTSLFVDGGILDNFPITAFDTLEYETKSYTKENKDFVKLNKRTLGLSLYTPGTKKDQIPNEVSNVFDLSKTLLELYFHSETLFQKLEPYDNYRNIKIDDLDVSTLEFQLSEEEKKALEESGKKATKKFFDEQEKRLKNMNLLIDPNEMSTLEKQINFRGDMT
ncbi:MAG: hypothetical protein K1060chlam4_00294 [Candidatus Anoxychlamydiales bacterium]|nr:hypothetical protein [Candidatus Anoxychlamydiales bacterium]